MDLLPMHDLGISINNLLEDNEVIDIIADKTEDC